MSQSFSRGRGCGRSRGRGRSRGNVVSTNLTIYELDPEMLRDNLPDETIDITPDILNEFWQAYMLRNLEEENIKVITFYKETHTLGYFSNFKAVPEYLFDLPVKLLEIPDEKLKYFPQQVECTNSEKTIMLCKAALFGDYPSYQKIAKTDNPRYAKQLGRKVTNFNQEIWNQKICHIANEIIYQKFVKGTDEMRQILKSTGTNIIAESSAGDSIWGIGMMYNNPDVHNPSTWKGTNIWDML